MSSKIKIKSSQGCREWSGDQTMRPYDFSSEYTRNFVLIPERIHEENIKCPWNCLFLVFFVLLITSVAGFTFIWATATKVSLEFLGCVSALAREPSHNFKFDCHNPAPLGCLAVFHCCFIDGWPTFPLSMPCKQNVSKSARVAKHQAKYAISCYEIWAVN